MSPVLNVACPQRLVLNVAVLNVACPQCPIGDKNPKCRTNVFTLHISSKCIHIRWRVHYMESGFFVTEGKNKLLWVGGLLESWRRTIINGTQFTWIPDTQFTWSRTIINDETQLTRTHSPQSQFYAGKSLLNAGWHLTNWGGGTTMNIFEKKNFFIKTWLCLEQGRGKSPDWW